MNVALFALPAQESMKGALKPGVIAAKVITWPLCPVACVGLIVPCAYDVCCDRTTAGHFRDLHDEWFCSCVGTREGDVTNCNEKWRRIRDGV